MPLPPRPFMPSVHPPNGGEALLLRGGTRLLAHAETSLDARGRRTSGLTKDGPDVPAVVARLEALGAPAKPPASRKSDLGTPCRGRKHASRPTEELDVVSGRAGHGCPGKSAGERRCRDSTLARPPVLPRADPSSNARAMRPLLRGPGRRRRGRLLRPRRPWRSRNCFAGGGGDRTDRGLRRRTPLSELDSEIEDEHGYDYSGKAHGQKRAPQQTPADPPRAPRPVSSGRPGASGAGGLQQRLDRVARLGQRGLTASSKLGIDERQLGTDHGFRGRPRPV
jgi:hypothetical protein